MNIVERLRQQVETTPDATAIIDTYQGRVRKTTFRELERASCQAASLLRQQDLKAGDAVLVFIPVSLELYVALIGIFRLGLVAMFVDPSAGRKHIDRCCQLHKPKGFIGISKAHLLRLLSPALRQIPYKFYLGWYVPGAINWRRLEKCGPHEPIKSSAGEEAALITFTSGSTGQPKGAVRSHDFLIAQHKALESSLNLRPGQIDLSTLPIFILANLASGVTSFIPNTDLRQPGSVDTNAVMAQIALNKPNRTAASPAFYECLVEHCERSGETLNCFEQVFTGGAPVFPKLLAKLQRLNPQGDVVAVYGSTEAEPIAHIVYSDISQIDLDAMMSGKGLLTGKPVDCIQLRIIKMHWGQPLGSVSKEEFEEEILPPGDVGEIVVSGEHVLKGYLNGVGDEETKFDVDNQRWHRTGDAGYLDDQGRLWLMGRCAALIKDAKGDLYPFAVESAAIHVPGVKRAALVEHQGKRLLLVEKDKEAMGHLSELEETLRWAKLDEIRSVRVIPVDKRHNAKIDYPALKRSLD